MGHAFNRTLLSSRDDLDEHGLPFETRVLKEVMNRCDSIK